MRKFWSYITNGAYSVGCTGRIVYVYDQTGVEVAKFKDIRHGYNAALSPSRNLLVVKSTGAFFAVYSLDQLSLIKTVKFSNVDVSQDDGYCFSKDGGCFYNIERQRSSTNHAISVYDTADFERVEMFLEDDEKIEPSCIECDEDGRIFVLGFLRGDNGVIKSGFVSQFCEHGLEDIRTISVEDYEDYHDFKRLELTGFTEKAKESSGFFYRNVDMTGIEQKKLPLGKLWERAGLIR